MNRTDYQLIDISEDGFVCFFFMFLGFLPSFSYGVYSEVANVDVMFVGESADRLW